MNIYPPPPPPSSLDLSSWYPDSGASHHVTDSTTSLSGVSPYTGSQQLTIGDGISLPITHTGNLITPSFRLSHVLVVPSITKNLSSVSQFSSDNNCYFLFSAHQFWAISRLTGQIILHGALDHGLYCLRPPGLPPPHALTATSSRLSSLWHHRLGHPAPDVQSHLLESSHISVSSNVRHSCTACAISKSHSQSHPPTLSRSSVPLQLVHFDVWGPSPVVSLNGNKYYICFVDDFSRFSWLYTFSSRSQFLDIFIRFHKFVENQLQCRLQAIQCDGAAEFVSSAFTSYLHQHGIHQRLSCPYAPFQNGTAERKHRHIVETGLALIHHAAVPTHFWDFAFETAVYLINRLPSAVNQYQSPWQLLFHHPPPIAHLRVFGCTIFPYLRPYSPRTHQFFIVADALFHEHDFPYHHPPPPIHHTTKSVMVPIPIPPPVVPSLTPPDPDPPTPPASSSTPTPEASPTPSPPPPARPITRLQDGTLQLRHLTRDHTYALIASTPPIPEPTCFSQAVRDPHWREAMAAEYTALIQNDTWTLVPLSFRCSSDQLQVSFQGQVTSRWFP